MAGWTIQVNTGAGFTAYRWKEFDFQLPLNQMGRAHALLAPGTTAPDEGDEIKIIWDLGGAAEVVWFRGSITTKTKDDFSGLIEVWCFDDSFTLFQSTLGAYADYGFRKYAGLTPYAIIQQAYAAGPPVVPAGLLYNGQNSLIMAYATTAPNAITAVSPGNTLNFRAQTGRNLLNIGRLCEQATYGATSYGLEWFVDRSGADAKQFNLVTRRQRAAVYTAESFQLGVSIHKSPRSTETENIADRVKVVGEGSGASRIESSWVGAGSRELVFSDKNVYDTTTATNLANRIYNALSTGTSPRFEARTHRHAITTRVGDDVDLVPKGGGGATTYRCLGISYHSRSRAFTLELGRSRRFFSTILRDVERSLDAMDIHAQLTDSVPVTLTGGTSQVTSTVGGAGVAVAAGALGTIVATSAPPADFGRAETYWIQLGIALSAGASSDAAAHTHDMGNHTHDLANHTHTGPSHSHTYDKADSPTGTTDAAGGGATAEPHAHTISHTPTATSSDGTGNTSTPSTNTSGVPSTNTTSSNGSAVTINGPFVVDLVLAYASGNDSIVATFTFPHMPTASRAVYATATFPFAVHDAGDFTPAAFEIQVSNLGPYNVTVDAATAATIYKKELHTHNDS